MSRHLIGITAFHIVTMIAEFAAVLFYSNLLAISGAEFGMLGQALAGSVLLFCGVDFASNAAALYNGISPTMRFGAFVWQRFLAVTGAIAALWVIIGLVVLVHPGHYNRLAGLAVIVVAVPFLALLVRSGRKNQPANTPASGTDASDSPIHS